MNPIISIPSIYDHYWQTKTKISYPDEIAPFEIGEYAVFYIRIYDHE